MVCSRRGLMGRELFAIDGMKLPRNAAKSKSGKRSDFVREAAKIKAAVQTMLACQRQADNAPEGSEAQRATPTVGCLQKEAASIHRWLHANPAERTSGKGKEVLSNRNDNESAKMALGKGVLRGYTAVAAVDAKAQIVIDVTAAARNGTCWCR